MKKFFSLSAIVAVLAMLMTSVSVSSCSSDDDDDSVATKSLLEQVVTSSTTSLSVAKGDTVAFYNAANNIKGTFAVTNVDTENQTITISIDGKTFTLSDADAGTSYLAYVNGYVAQQTSDFADNASKVILAKKTAASSIISGTESGASQKAGAGKTVFLKK